MAVYNEQNKKKWTKDGRHWYYVVYYKDFSGKRLQKRSKMYESKDEAEEAEALFILQKNNPSKKKFVIVADAFFMDYKKRKKESSYESYLYAYNKHIRPYFNDYYITDIILFKCKITLEKNSILWYNMVTIESSVRNNL